LSHFVKIEKRKIKSYPWLAVRTRFGLKNPKVYAKFSCRELMLSTKLSQVALRLFSSATTFA
jgi:hypothetical protein